MPTMATKTTRPRSSRTLRAAFGVLPKKRSRDTSEDTITPDTSRPPALPRPTFAPKAGNWIRPIRKPRIMPTRQRQQVGGGAWARDAARHLAELVDGALQADDRRMSMRCSLVFRPAGIGTPPRSNLHDLQLAGDRLIAERLERPRRRPPCW